MFSTHTAQSLDGVHVRQFACMSDEGLECLACGNLKGGCARFCCVRPQLGVGSECAAPDWRLLTTAIPGVTGPSERGSRRKAARGTRRLRRRPEWPKAGPPR
eukprot:5853306-Pyramimonas_sp.AAC.1